MAPAHWGASTPTSTSRRGLALIRSIAAAKAGWESPSPGKEWPTMCVSDWAREGVPR